MNGRWTMGIAAAAMIAAAAPAVAQVVEGRTVYVDLEKVFTEFYRTKQADAQLKDLADDFKSERREMIDAFDKLQDEFKSLREEAQNTALSEDVRNEKRMAAEERLVEIREQESKIRRFDESRQKQLDEQSRRMRKRIVEEITKEIESFVRSEGYGAVVDSSGETLNGVPVVIYRDPKLDVTDTVLSILNRGQATAPAARPTPSLQVPAP